MRRVRVIARTLGLLGLCLCLRHAMPAELSRQVSTTTSFAMWVGMPTLEVGRRYPLVLWLHGFSLRGSDLDLLKTYGPVAPYPVGAEPYLLVAPQLPKSRLLWPSADLEKLLDEVVARYPVDPARISLMGASLGSAAAWTLAGRVPGRIGAVISVAGSGSTRDGLRSEVRSARFFHGRDDTTVPLGKVETLVSALRGVGADVELQVFDGVGHEPQVFDAAVFRNEAVYRWAFARPAPALRAATSRPPAGGPLLSAPEIIESLFDFEHRRPGTPSGRRAEEALGDRIRALGLEPQRDVLDLQV